MHCMHAELTLPLDISIQGRRERKRGRDRGENRGRSVGGMASEREGEMNMTRRKRTYFQHLGVAARAACRLLSVCLPSAAEQRVNRSFIAKWIL